MDIARRELDDCQHGTELKCCCCKWVAAHAKNEYRASAGCQIISICCSAAADHHQSTPAHHSPITFHQAPPAKTHTAIYTTDSRNPSWYHLAWGT